MKKNKKAFARRDEHGAGNGKKRILKIFLLPVLLLAAFLSACFLIRVEQTCRDSGGEYSIVSVAGRRLLLYHNGAGIPDFNWLNTGNESPFTLSGLAYKGEEYAVLVSGQGLAVYNRGKLILGYENENRMKTVSSFVADRDGDGNDDIFLLLGKEREKYGERLIVLNYNGGKMEKTYDVSFQKVNPWKVQVCDVDGDGEREISLGVYTEAKFHPVYAKRPFLYNFSKNKLYPKWLGSRLSRPFDDYIFCDVDGDKMDELISVETTRDGKKELDAYKWKGFGFESIGVSQSYDSLSGLKADGERITAVCGGRCLQRQRAFVFENNKIDEEESFL